jgi:CYTH domain-containing protein
VSIARVAGEGRYAQLEREQRWLLAGVPPGAQHPTAIVDVYLSGTRLRLRRAEAGGVVVRKLTQKVRARPDSPEVVKATTVYLSAREHDEIARLGGAELRKTRWRVCLDGRAVAVDEFEGRLAGLVLAEVELALEDPRLPRPPFAVADVTDDERLAGGQLAEATPDEVGRLLREVAALPGAPGDGAGLVPA